MFRLGLAKLVIDSGVEWVVMSAYLPLKGWPTVQSYFARKVFRSKFFMFSSGEALLVQLLKRFIRQPRFTIKGLCDAQIILLFYICNSKYSV